MSIKNGLRFPNMTSVDWVDGRVRFIDQTRLPAEEVYVETTDPAVIEEAITSLRIRGAPAIGVAAAFAVCLALGREPNAGYPQQRDSISPVLHSLALTRPTAVNLFAALNRMRNAFEAMGPAEADIVRSRMLQEACAIRDEDVEACRRIGILGAGLIRQGSTILTHCNTGALATAGEGTAQSIITTAAREGKIRKVYVDETRPLFQGARLTAWELQKHGIDVTVITDSTAGYLMQKGKISAVIVGADRIAANGDVANKIGTYSLAVLAHHHDVPFYVAAPTSTLDVGTPSGDAIMVEERNPVEVTHVAGVRIAAEGARVFAPAFDITPARLITAIITEKCILAAPYEKAISALCLENHVA